MKRIDYMRTLGDEELIRFIYVNGKHFKMGLKNLTLWLGEEMEKKDIGEVTE